MHLTPGTMGDFVYLWAFGDGSVPLVSGLLRMLLFTGI